MNNRINHVYHVVALKNDSVHYNNNFLIMTENYK